MSPRARALIGVMTALFFAGSGLSLFLADQRALGGLLIGLGLLRGVYAIIQWRDAFSEPNKPN